MSRIAYHTYYFRVPHDSESAAELADSIIPAFLPKLIAIITLFLVSTINAISIRAGIHVQDGLTILKVLTALFISILGVVFLAQGNIRDNSLEVPPFQGIDSLTFGKYAVALYSGKHDFKYVA